ncbi:MAG: DUF342 domain-containing protein [Clostridiaceae bacterium]|nr:DUF342 domain-containing protein [Clostridiaceae bacterium]
MDDYCRENERVKVEVTADQLKAYLYLNIPEEELEPEYRKTLIDEILNALAKKQVVYGIKTELLHGELENHQRILIAEGIPPVNGEDSVIRMYEIEGPKPKVIDNDKVNYYPKVRIEIKDVLEEVTEESLGRTYYYNNYELCVKD